MNRYPLWKNLMIGIALILGLLYTLPNFFGEIPAVQISAKRAPTKVDTTTMSRAEQALKQEKIESLGMELDEKSLRIRFKDTDTQLKAKTVLEKTFNPDSKLDTYVVALNLVPNSPRWMTAIGAHPMFLGLDLRGGVHFLLQVDMQGATSKTLERFSADIRARMREKKLPYSGLAREGNRIVIKFRDAEQRGKATAELKQGFAELALREEEADFRIVATLKPESLVSLQKSSIDQNITTLRNRVNELGVAEPIVQQQGIDRIVVQLPGVQDTAKAKDILGRTAALEVRMVEDDPAKVAQAQQGIVPPGTEVYPEKEGNQIVVRKQVVLTGDYINDAQPGFTDSGEAAVHINLDNRGARIFKQLTRENVGKRMAILLIEKGKGEVVTAPVIREEIGGGRVQISGSMSSEEARDVSLLLRAGALAAPMEIVEERTVGPSLGAEHIARGFNSTLYGFAAIALFMLVYYRIFGVVSTVALGVNLLFLISLLSLLQATLTLPGIAAIALTLGMAIDANVLINERIREELRLGVPPHSAIHTGYDRAFDTILDSNVTTLIAGLALFLFGTGPVKGFAVVHCLGILTSMFSAVVVSRGIVNLIYGRQKKLAGLSI